MPHANMILDLIQTVLPYTYIQVLHQITIDECKEVAHLMQTYCANYNIPVPSSFDDEVIIDHWLEVLPQAIPKFLVAYRTKEQKQVDLSNCFGNLSL